MIKNILLLIAVMLLSTDLHAESNIHYIRHFDYSKPTSTLATHRELPKKAKRVSSTKGEINLIFYDEIPDSIRTAIMVAKELWEAKLHNKKPIYIEVGFESFEDGTVMCTETGILEEEHNFIPCALASQWRDQRDDYNEQPDGYIGLSADIDWNCCFSNNNNSTYNVTTMVLRGIARCLGFVSSIQQNSKGSYSFNNTEPTVFDRHLYNESLCLGNLLSDQPGLTKFVTSDNVSFLSNSTKYPIYSPKEYGQGESLCYLKSQDSLMSQSLGEGNLCLDIDHDTIDILNSLGWNLPFEVLRIKCEDLDESGIGSCYQSYVFTLTDNDININKYSWSFFSRTREVNTSLFHMGTQRNFPSAVYQIPLNTIPIPMAT